MPGSPVTTSTVWPRSPVPGVGTGGFAGPATPEVQDALRLKLNWHDGGLEGPGQLRAVFAACLAVAAGLARHVLVYRTVTESTAQGEGGRQGIGGRERRPRHPALLGIAAVDPPLRRRVRRELAGADRPAPHVRVRADPGAAGVDRPQRPAQRGAQPQGHLPRPDDARRLPRRADDLDAAVSLRLRRTLRRVDRGRRLARRLRPRRTQHGVPRQRHRHGPAGPTELGPVRRHDARSRPATRRPACGSAPSCSPSDVDVAELYDGFSILTMVWLEELGLCGQGRERPLRRRRHRIALDGAVPLNTSGGQLSAGRLHGFGMLHEACVQLRGEGGDRQVPSDPRGGGGGGRGRAHRRVHAAHPRPVLGHFPLSFL